MLEEKTKLTVSELKTYLYSLEDEKELEKLKRIAEYKEECEEKEKEVKDKKISSIKRKVEKEYKEKLDTKDYILDLLEECASIPYDMEKLEIAKYMIYRVDIRRAENLIEKVINELGNRYNEIVERVEDELYDFPQFDDIEEIDFSEYKCTGENLAKAKEKFKEEYTEEEKMKLVQKEIDIVEKSKEFNAIPIPHEILKNSDRDIQSKMKKFNDMRRRRQKILDTMKDDYIKLIEPKEIDTMIDDALDNIKLITDILTDSEYNRVRRSLIRRRKRIHSINSELINMVKTKEIKTGIINYNIQEARYQRMQNLTNIINSATKKISEYSFVGGEEQLEKLKESYKKEKQYESIIKNIDEEEGKEYSNSEIKELEIQISNLEKTLETSRKVTKEEQEKIDKAKKELFILWKIEIDSTISRKKEVLELPSEVEEIAEYKVQKESIKKTFLTLKKNKNGKHACV